MQRIHLRLLHLHLRAASGIAQHAFLHAVKYNQSLCYSQKLPRNLLVTGKLCHSGQQWHVPLDATVASLRVERGGGAAFVHCGSSSGLNYAITFESATEPFKVSSVTL